MEKAGKKEHSNLKKREPWSLHLKKCFLILQWYTRYLDKQLGTYFRKDFNQLWQASWCGSLTSYKMSEMFPTNGLSLNPGWGYVEKAHENRRTQIVQ